MILPYRENKEDWITRYDIRPLAESNTACNEKNLSHASQSAIVDEFVFENSFEGLSYLIGKVKPGPVAVVE